MNQFNRKVSLLIGTPGLQGKQLDKLAFEFFIKKTETRDENTLRLTIYNLSKETRDHIQALRDIVILKTGYTGTNLEVIFNGLIKDINHYYSAPNWITEMTVNDNGNLFDTIRLNLSYTTGTQLTSIIQDIVSQTNVNLKPLPILQPKQYVFGFYFMGYAKDVLDIICNDLDCKWSIQNGSLKLVKNGTTDNSEIVNLSPSTGLIGRPVWANSVTKEKDKNNEAIWGWKISSLLQPKIEPGGRVMLNSIVATNNLCKVIDVEHQGETHGPTWETRLNTVIV